MTTWILLLRAVNLGAHNKLSMSALREALAAGGCDDPRTYLQSGNVVCRSSLRSERRVADTVSQLILARFGLHVPLAVRTDRQLAECVAAMPFVDAAAELPTRTVVTFFDVAPDPERVHAFNATDFGSEQARVIGRECYSVHPDGIHTSRLTASYLHRTLGDVGGTGRNWRTVLALQALAAETTGARR